MGERRRLGIQDALWLEMDRDNNLMVVDSVIWTETPLDRDRLRAVVEERLCQRYPVYRSRARKGDDGGWYWEEDPDFDLDDHVTEVTLPAPGGQRQLQEFIASQRTVPLDRSKPLWTSFVIDDYLGGSAVVIRTHHAIADGMRMVQVSMSLFDASPEGGAIMAPPVTQHAAAPKPPGQSVAEQLRDAGAGAGRQAAEATSAVTGRVSEVIADPLGAATDGAAAVRRGVSELAGAVGGVVSEATRIGRGAATNPVGAAHTTVTEVWRGLGQLAGTVRRLPEVVPGRGPLVDLFSAAPGDIDTARKLLVGTRNDVALWTGPAGVDKAVAWSEPLPLADVKAVARASQATVNDVLVACTAGTLHAYLEAHQSPCASVTFMVPVNLKPIDTTLPDELGNSFALVQLELPTDLADPQALLAVVKRRMNRIKLGHEAAVSFRVQEVISGLNRTVYEASVDLLANRTVGVLTNVPGPPVPVYFAGSRVAGIVGWAPLSGDQPLSFTIYSYAGNVFVGIACDAGLVPDHQTIVDGFAPAFDRLRATTATR